MAVRGTLRGTLAALAATAALAPAAAMAQEPDPITGGTESFACHFMGSSQPADSGRYDYSGPVICDQINGLEAGPGPLGHSSFYGTMALTGSFEAVTPATVPETQVPIPSPIRCMTWKLDGEALIEPTSDNGVSARLSYSTTSVLHEARPVLTGKADDRLEATGAGNLSFAEVGCEPLNTPDGRAELVFALNLHYLDVQP